MAILLKYPLKIFAKLPFTFTKQILSYLFLFTKDQGTNLTQRLPVKQKIINYYLSQY